MTTPFWNIATVDLGNIARALGGSHLQALIESALDLSGSHVGKADPFRVSAAIRKIR